MKKGGVPQILTHSTFFLSIALAQASLGNVPCLADRVAGKECIKHSPYTTVPENLTSFDGFSRDECWPLDTTMLSQQKKTTRTVV